MESDEIKAWFWSQSAEDRAASLFSLMHMMTVDFRGVALDHPSDVIVEVAKKFNELFHSLSGYGLATLSGLEQAPEDTFIESVVLSMQQPDLRPYLSLALRDVERMIKSSAST